MRGRGLGSGDKRASVDCDVATVDKLQGRLTMSSVQDSYLDLMSRRDLVPKDEVRLSVSELSEISDGCKYAPSSQRRRGQDGELGDSGYLYILRVTC